MIAEFTGKERDAETGLDFFGARYMSAAQGRFTSPDPFSIVMEAEDREEFDEHLADPQNWNRYAYVSNNPLKYIDPDGRNKLLMWIANPANQRMIEGYARRGAEAANRYGTAAYNWATQFFNSPTGQEITQATIETVTGSEAPNLTPASAGSAVKGAFEVAAEGGRHAGFLSNYLGRSGKELERGIASIEREIATHLDKIKNPAKHIEGFDKLDPRQQQSLINKIWPSDVQRQREQLEILKRIREQQEQR